MFETIPSLADQISALPRFMTEEQVKAEQKPVIEIEYTILGY